MEHSDKLVEYYFHRRIAGMEFSEIRKSLAKQFFEEDERESILRQVELKENYYLKKIARQKMIRVILCIGGGILLLAIAAYIYTQSR